MGRHAPTAEIADPAGGNAGDEHEISCMKGRDARADGLDHAHALVSKNAARGDAGNVTLQDMKVRAANGRSGDSNDGVAALTNGRLRFVLPRALAGAAVDQGFMTPFTLERFVARSVRLSTLIEDSFDRAELMHPISLHGARLKRCPFVYTCARVL